MKTDIIYEPLINIINKIRISEFEGLDLKPQYKRTRNCKTEFQDNIIYSLVKGYSIGDIIIRELDEPNSKGAMTELIDGYHRLKTVYDFIEGQYVMHSDVSRQIIETMQNIFDGKIDPTYEKLKRKLDNKGKIKLKYEDFPSIIKAKFEGKEMSIIKVKASTDEIIEYLRFMQKQDRALSNEILNHITSSNLSKYINQIKDIDKFCNIISSNKKDYFNKIFSNVVGVLDNKISLGVSDKIINKYEKEIIDITDAKDGVEEIIHQINIITDNYNNQVLVANTKMRYLKYMLLLIGYKMVDFTTNTEQKLQSLKYVDDKLTVCFSSDKDKIKNMFEGYTDDTINDFNAIALISKGAHRPNEVKKVISLLASYINEFKKIQVLSN